MLRWVKFFLVKKKDKWVMKVFLKKQKQFGKKQWLIEKKNACHYYKKIPFKYS